MRNSIFFHTQRSYEQTMEDLLGKGRQHAGKLYAQWFRKGFVPDLDRWVEPQAVALVQNMIAHTDFSLPHMSQIQEREGVVKFLLEFEGGVESESVLIPMQSGTTLCLSSQIGCRMGCAFCETGKMGLIRPLMAEEMVMQAFFAQFELKRKVRNLVFMGMGEPFDNYDAVMKAICILTDPAGWGLGRRRVTISTSGHVEGIKRMAKEADPALNLAVSINAPTDALRQSLMPVNRRWNLAELKEAMQLYCAKGARKILIGYVLLKGVNDSVECATNLACYLEGLQVRINLIPYNAQRADRFAPSEEEQRVLFAQTLRSLGCQVLLRGAKGGQIKAACGQLGNSGHRKSEQIFEEI